MRTRWLEKIPLTQPSVDFWDHHYCAQIYWEFVWLALRNFMRGEGALSGEFPAGKTTVKGRLGGGFALPGGARLSLIPMCGESLPTQLEQDTGG